MSELNLIYELFQAHPTISTDTRNILPGSLFFALKGENFDANEFALDAINKGAAYAVVDRPELEGHEKCILVEDVLSTLQELGRHHRRKLGLPMIGITGSNGKTTTKELLHAVLSKKFNVLATAGNYNNHIGVPLTLLRLTDQHELAIIEMGANHQGEIDFLCKLSEPNYGFITNIGKAHIEGFGGVEGIRKGKTEMYRFINAQGGKIFVNTADPVLMESSEGMNRILFGPGAGWNLSYDTNEEGRILVNLEKQDEHLRIQSNLFGSYNFNNILFAFSAGEYFGVYATDIVAALEEYAPDNNRSQIKKTQFNTLIMDAYNANPSSVELALNSFAEMKAEKKMVILGDMLELGKDSRKEHQKIIDMLGEIRADAVFLVGPEYQALNTEFEHFSTSNELRDHLKEVKPKDYAILIKGSRSIRLENVLEAL